MSECVVRMEMPQGCEDCPFRDMLLCCCAKGRKYAGSSPVRPNWYPIVCQLPENHGQLVDADALIELMLERKQPLLGADNSKDRYRYIQWLADFNAIRDTKTIIPAERSEV